MKNISRLIEVLVDLQKHYNEITPNYCEHVHTCTVSVRILFCLVVFFLGGDKIYSCNIKHASEPIFILNAIRTFATFWMFSISIALQTWFDESLKWDPNKYENTTRLVVFSTKLWLPDMFVFNTYGFVLNSCF